MKPLPVPGSKSETEETPPNDPAESADPPSVQEKKTCCGDCKSGAAATGKGCTGQG
jgi:hypothetical protein